IVGEVELGEAELGVENSVGIGQCDAGEHRLTLICGPALGHGLASNFAASGIVIGGNFAPQAGPKTHFPTLRGFSITTSVAFLSVRRPKNTGWRISPFDVHSVNFTSATSFGLTQVVLAASGTFSGTGLESVMSGTSFACSDLSVARSNPVPTRPT